MVVPQVEHRISAGASSGSGALHDAPQDTIRPDGNAEMAPVDGDALRIIHDGDDVARRREFTLLIDSQNTPSQALRKYDDVIRVLQRATSVPKNRKVNYYDHVRCIALNTIRDPRGFCSHSRYRRDSSSRSNFGRSTSILMSPEVSGK